MAGDRDGDGLARRTILAGAGLGIASAALAGSPALGAPAAGGAPEPAPIDQGSASAGKVTFSPIHADTERPEGQPPNPDAPGRRVGFAIVGLGRLALENILPAFAECKHARPTALVSGDPAKMRAVAEQYGIPASSCYDYAGFDRIRDDPAVDVVYVVLPNALHKDAVIRAARAGKHVLCEKPMATSPQEAREMIAACAKAGKQLMIAYRCQYEVNNRELVKRARAGEFGAVQLIDAINTQNQGDPNQWRQRRALAGGGSLPDVGLYCLNTTRAILGEEPIWVSATIHDPEGDARFREVESNVSFVLRFPSGVIANCLTSYSTHEHRNIRVMGASGTGEIQNAFAYDGQRLRTMRRDGEADVAAEVSLSRKNQFALEIDHMAQCARTNTRPHTPGEEGLQDQVVMAAIYESARSGRPVRLLEVKGRDPFRGAPADDAG